MAAQIPKHPLEIPPPSEKDWLKDDEEDFFLQDPDRERDALPQPFRMVNKLVTLVFENAMEIIERREMLREAEKLKVQPTKCFPTAEFQVTGRANCLAVSGKYIFVGLSEGLAAFTVFNWEEVCAWDAVKTEICAIHALDLENEHHILLAVDEMGLVWLFCFRKESFQLIKILNEVEDISKRSTCVEVVLSPGGDYAGFLLQDSTKAWLEIYRLPKDSWLKEMEKSSGAAAGLAHWRRRSIAISMKSLELRGDGSAEMESPVSATKADAKLSLPVLLLKVKPPKPVTGSSFKSPLDALKKLDDGIMLGLGYNHLIKDSQWEQQEGIFCSTYPECMEAEGERKNKEEIPRHATLHFLPPSQILQVQPEMKVQPDVPAGISVHWDGSHNLCFYLLNHPLKDKADSDPKPEVVWPCAAPIVCSAVSSCSRYLALACEDAIITIWDTHLGYPLSVTAILEERLIRSIHFLQRSAAASDETPCPGTDPACPIVQLLVLCTDSSFYLVKTPMYGKSSITLLADRPEDPNLAVSAVVPVLALPSAALVFSWNGTVSLMNTATSQIVYCFSIPPSHAVASPWQPVFTVDRRNWCLLLQGYKQHQRAALAESTASHSTIFVFDFNSYPLREAFPKEPSLPLKSMQNLPWVERCNIFLHERQQGLPGPRELLPEYWSRLQAQAAAMDKERQKVKGQKKL
ncbi:WD repeat-containing protein 93 [Patagioenas fasciata monilis]|uniref:WD repeat-containing protein 93 n=1 Tax=Patagioenas fasciata monilis TaxID=372326 RepID=A0A1V4JEA4_PATFA|nr:WD repeat-containing protein 93 [Patagioenas fasciata monilis]